MECSFVLSTPAAGSCDSATGGLGISHQPNHRQEILLYALARCPSKSGLSSECRPAQETASELDRQCSSVVSGRCHLPTRASHLFANYNYRGQPRWVEQRIHMATEFCPGICFSNITPRSSSVRTNSTALIMVCLFYSALFTFGLRAVQSSVLVLLPFNW